MRACAWSCIVAGILLAAAALVIAANKPALNPWPSLLAAFCVAAVGIVLLATGTRVKNDEARCVAGTQLRSVS